MNYKNGIGTFIYDNATKFLWIMLHFSYLCKNFASAAFDKDANEVIVKVSNTSKQVQPIRLNLKDLTGVTTAQTITLSHAGMDDENSIQRPELIIPQRGTIAVGADKKQSVINDQLPPMSFRIYRVNILYH